MLGSCSLLLFDWLRGWAAVELTYGESLRKICGSCCSQSDWCLCVSPCVYSYPRKQHFLSDSFTESWEIITYYIFSLFLKHSLSVYPHTWAFMNLIILKRIVYLVIYLYFLQYMNMKTHRYSTFYNRRLQQEANVLRGHSWMHLSSSWLLIARTVTKCALFSVCNIVFTHHKSVKMEKST